MIQKQALVAFGGNLQSGDLPPEATIRKALLAFPEFGITVQRVSTLYSTPCFPTGAGPDYVNAAAILTLRHIHSAEGVLAAGLNQLPETQRVSIGPWDRLRFRQCS
mgnify:CR=1 FL=1